MAQRGLSKKHEQNYERIIRDTRTLSQRIADFLRNPRGVAYLLIACAVTTFVLPGIADIVLALSILFFCVAYFRKPRLPFRMPLRSKAKDYNDIHPGTGKPNVAQGIYFFGNEKEENDELWFGNDDMRTHVLIFGSTGSGKTESLIGLSYNALLQASGLIYVDGKGDNSLFAKMFSLVRSMGREDDILLVNFMTGARDIIGPQKTRLSNTINPFAMGSSSMLSQLVVSLMDSASQSPDGDMWKGRAISFVEALMKVLVAMRDGGHILLDANTIRNYFHLPKLETIVIDKVFPRDKEEAVSLEGLPDNILEPIVNYVLNLPGYNPEKKGKQVSQVLEQHGFITMQLTRVFTSLADTYGHILRTKLAEVDLKDVVLNRRILIALLPALEKSPEELSNLGKVIIASLRAMMAAGLGDNVEGEYADLVDSKPTNAKTPFLCILDEYGYYAVKGFAVVPAQARSLGFSVVFAGQDLPAFQKASKEEAASIGANTNIKICMKLEDPTETWDFFMKTGGESYVTHVDSFQVDSGSVLGNYNDAKGARLEKRSRVDLLDLKEQQPGEAHFFFKSKIVRGRFFYANPPKIKQLRLNHFLKVDEPSDTEIIKLRNSLDQFTKIAKKASSLLQVEEQHAEEIEQFLTRYDATPKTSCIDAALMAFSAKEVESDDSILDSFFADLQQSEEEADYLNAFTPMRYSDYLRDVLLVKEEELSAFRQPILNRAELRDQIEYLQRLCGSNSQQGMNIAVELVNDMQKGSQYPPASPELMPASVLAAKVNELSSAIQLKKQEGAME